ncbi:hypothetical protein [Paenibacillus lactis]|uniref:hypothetical protein n=1 Tax=Paenibacillus lactis TaxID=228574 RepID=UPI001B1D1E7C|nr:hypothetical protein [Paenibacillus lactis]GIO92001.1 hypothetical protein J31TS3_32280 [Paenibacillus lactis]
MNKKHIRTIVIASGCLVLLGLVYMVRGFIDYYQSLNTTIHNAAPSPKALQDWQKDYDRRVRSEPAERVVTKYGDFYYASSPNSFPRSEIANLDADDEVTQDTKQIILKGYYYEKKL